MEYIFDLHDMINDKKHENVDFSYLRKCDLNASSLTKYHRLFCYFKKCVYICM